MALSKIAAHCRACPKVDTCDHKRMECHGYLPEPNLASAVGDNLQDLTMPLAVKHDYRDIKVSENMTVTIDVEELKEKIANDIYKEFRQCFYNA